MKTQENTENQKPLEIKIKKEVKSTTLVKGFVIEHPENSKEFYLVSTGRFFKRLGGVVHKCNNLGKKVDFNAELFYSTSNDPVVVFTQYLESLTK